MTIAPPVHLTVRSNVESTKSEIVLRIVAATLTTLLALAAAQLILPNQLIAILTILTLVGVPVSLVLRFRHMRVGKYVIGRPLWNSLTILTAGAITVFGLFGTFQEIAGVLAQGGGIDGLMLRIGDTGIINILLRSFLIFAAIRSFALISDKDATLATVPSFSVLLLMMPLHKGIEVVLYFLVWILVAAALFALDYRSDGRDKTDAFIPVARGGQGNKMAARSLVGLLSFSLVAAGGLSYLLTSGNSDQQSSTENAVSALASRLTHLVISSADVPGLGSGNRQIDFSSGPSLPSKTALWRIQTWTYGNQPVFPAYLRLYTLDTYNGETWLSRSKRPFRSKRTRIDIQNWPNRRIVSLRGNYARFRIPFGNTDLQLLRTAPGFAISKANQIKGQFGPPSMVIQQILRSQVDGVGFIPTLPTTRAVSFPDNLVDEVRIHKDGSLEMGYISKGQRINTLSDVPGLPEYGASGSVERYRESSWTNSRKNVILPADEREAALQLPPTLPPRVSDLARSMLKRTTPLNNYQKALRISQALQVEATYTLRPPSASEGQDATDYFLFDGGKRGYCTHFAGALTVLCRTQGIPARVVSGFTNIETSSEGVGLIRAANAHAWTEVWLEGWGWTLVDATPVDNRGDNSPTWIENTGDILTALSARTLKTITENLVLVFVLIAMISIGLTNQLFAKGPSLLRHKHSLDGERHIIQESYERMSRRITRRHRLRAPGETPHEWVHSYAQSLPQSQNEGVKRLTALYLQSRYALNPMPPGSGESARQALRQFKKKAPK